MALQIQVAEPGLNNHEIFESKLVDLLLRSARHLTFFILTPLNGPPHPSVFRVVIVVYEKIVILEVGAVVFPIVIHVDDFLVQKFHLAWNQGNLVCLVVSIFACVHIDLHLEVRISIFIESTIQNLRVQIEVATMISMLFSKL